MSVWRLDWRIDQTAVIQHGPGTFEINVVGTKRHQAVLAAIAGRTTDRGALVCEAVLLIDDQNQNDRNAVTVQIDGYIVGSLSWPHALRFRDALNEHRGVYAARCDSVILSPAADGEFDERWFRVALDLPPPVPPGPEPDYTSDYDDEVVDDDA